LNCELCGCWREKIEMGKYFIIVDVGCIECGEQTEVKGIYKTRKAAAKAFDKVAKELKIENWKPRGRFLELLGLHEKNETTYLGGTGYFNGGQHALELHIYPAKEIEKESQQST